MAVIMEAVAVWEEHTHILLLLVVGQSFIPAETVQVAQYALYGGQIDSTQGPIQQMFN
jgi:hypothetical protein